MQQLSIAQNTDGVFIHIDTNSVSKEKVDEALRLLKLFFFDDSHIPPVSAEEQLEIEASLGSMSEEDKEVAFSRVVSL